MIPAMRDACRDTDAMLMYLRLMNVRVGLLINFGAPSMKQGIKRIANGPPPCLHASV